MTDEKVDVRKPPVGARLRLHPQGVRGTCGWCGGAVTERTPGRGWLKWWHGSCWLEMGIAEQPSIARAEVFKRDAGVCCDCGEDWSDRFLFVPSDYVSPWTMESGRYDPDRVTPGPDGKRLVHISSADGFPFIWLKTISLWHVDHKVPLWKVRHLPPLQRLAFFLLANLVTRCHRCHGRKTDEEAAERAHHNRLAAGKPDKPKSRWGSRPWPPKGSRPMKGKRK